MAAETTSFQKLVDIIAQLRNPDGGCPWDLEQTHKSLRPYLIEEAYETLEAIEEEDEAKLAEELGDVLLQVVLHSQLASEQSAFSIEDVIRLVSEKMIRRHPHVFGEKSVSGSSEVLKNWEQIKLTEKGSGTKKARESVLEGVPRAMPALVRAQRLGEKAARVHFDWTSAKDVRAKIDEELRELDDEIPAKPISEKNKAPEKVQAALEHELGDVLFAICQLARWLNLDAEHCLHASSRRFICRFAELERGVKRPLEEFSVEELEREWQKAKKRLALEPK